MCAVIHFRIFFISAFGRKILLSYSKPHSLSGKLERDKSYLPKCDSSVMPGNTVFHFATAVSLGLRRSMNSSNSWHTPFFSFDCDAITPIRVLLDEHANGLGVRVLAGACGLSRYSCGNPNLSRRDADDPLE
jgi:hypothetical protein